MAKQIKSKKKDVLFPMKLQFFAEGGEGTETNKGTEGTDPQNEPTTPTVEELIAQLAEEKAANEKNKAALDKALKEKGALTKSLRAKQTAEEQEAEAKKEQEEQRAAYISELETFKKTAEAKARYAMQGMDAVLAEKAAEAEISGDMDALSKIQKQYTDQIIKEKQTEWMRTRKEPNAGGQYSSMTREQIMAIPDRSERRKAIAENLSAFDS